MSQEICRLCLSETADFQSIFDEVKISEKSVQLSELVASFATIQISIGDGLPDHLCNSCADQAANLYVFKLRCEDSDKVLRSRLESQKELKRVLKEVAPKKKFKCEICHKKFSKIDSLIKHQLVHAIKTDKETNFICDLCLFEISDEDLFNEHLSGHLCFVKSDTDDEYITCGECKEELKSLNDFKKHILNKHPDVTSTKFTCPICTTQYIKKGNFTNHMKCRHHKDPDEIDDENVLCDHCNKLFKSTDSLQKHLRKLNQQPVQIRNKGGQKKLHVCEICFKTFNQMSNLKDHLRTHNGEKPFLCPTCGKGFNQLGNLRQHQVRHSGIKSYVCTTCGHGFASKGELRAHLPKHTGARPFVCDECGHGFTTSSSLTKHKRIHSGEKPYECEYCKMKFARSGILSRHRRIHTGEKPYVCEICKKAFTQSNDLNSHLRIHTGEKPYKCDECGQPFRQKSALKMHKKIHMKSKDTPVKMAKKEMLFVEQEENVMMMNDEEFADIERQVEAVKIEKYVNRTQMMMNLQVIGPE